MNIKSLKSKWLPIFILFFIVALFSNYIYLLCLKVLSINPSEFVNSLFRAGLMALFALLSWWVQEKYKITLQKNKISKLIQEINRALQPAFSTNLDPREIAKIKEEILDTSVCEDVKLLKESIYNLASFKSVSSEVISASSNLYNTLYAKRDLIDCQPHLNTLIIFFK